MGMRTIRRCHKYGVRSTFHSSNANRRRICNRPLASPTNASMAAATTRVGGLLRQRRVRNGYWHSAVTAPHLSLDFAGVTTPPRRRRYSKLATAFVRNTESPTAAVRPAACRDYQASPHAAHRGGGRARPAPATWRTTSQCRRSSRLSSSRRFVPSISW